VAAGQCVIAGFKPNIVEEVTSTQEVFHLVQDGVGTAIVPAGICGEVPPALQCSPIHGMEALQLVFIYRFGNSQTAQRIVSEIANSLRLSSKGRLMFFLFAANSDLRPFVSESYKRHRGDRSKASSQSKKILDNRKIARQSLRHDRSIGVKFTKPEVPMNLSPAWRRHIRVSPVSKTAFLLFLLMPIAAHAQAAGGSPFDTASPPCRTCLPERLPRSPASSPLSLADTSSHMASQAQRRLWPALPQVLE
jgi:hypothetical protein